MEISVGPRTLLAKSCLTCGELKQAKDFAQVSAKYRNSYCHKCKNLRVRPLMHGHQRKSSNGAVNHGQPWTVGDIHALSAMVSEGRSGPQMALVLNRTVYSVYTMKNKLNKES